MNEELRQLLRSARPSGQDEQDPAVASARADAAEDAVLTAALAEERLADAAFARALQSTTTPPDLESRLRAALRAAQLPANPPADMEQRLLSAVRSAAPATSRPAAFSRRRWMLWSSAAAAALAAGGVFWWRRSRPLSLESLTEELAEICHDGITLSLVSRDKSATAAWMKDNGAPQAASLPGALDALGRKGCQLYMVAGHPVSLECFRLAGGALLHLFCTGVEELSDPPAAGVPPRVFTAHGHTAATWTHGPRTLILLSHEPPETIQSLLA